MHELDGVVDFEDILDEPACLLIPGGLQLLNEEQARLFELGNEWLSLGHEFIRLRVVFYAV